MGAVAASSATTEVMTGAERFRAAVTQKPVDVTPVWFMRQAGRCLAQYRELRDKYDILTITRTPELASQVTLMPVQEFGVDAAVLYADIMLPLFGMGVPFSIDPGVGPIVHAPLRDEVAINALRLTDPHESVPDLFETIRLVKSQLNGEKTLIGFAGGPFTLASYMIEGRPSKEFAHTKSLLFSEPALWARLMETLTEVTITYLRAQVDAGAEVIQLFDSWNGALSHRHYQERVLPYVARIFEAVAAMGVPSIHFGTGCSHLLELMASVQCDAVSVDWRLPLDEAWQRIGNKAIQGNLDPGICLASWPVVEAEVRRILDLAAGRPGHIFNLGHGVLADTDPGILRKVVELVHTANARSAS